ncbi:MAG: sulfatase-like hydrolase/transferase, partial [Planctomycetota bacterium]
MSKRPNILVLMTDQQSADALSCAGNADLHTPNLDRLAGRGVRFERAYSTFPLCGPFRAGMITGRYPHQVGCMNNQAKLADEHVARSMGHLFRAAGYATAYGGKWHAGGPIDLRTDADKFGFEHLCGINDHQLPDACNAYLRRDHDRPFLLFASFDNPHNICEHSRDQLLPWGEVEDVGPGAHPNLPANFAPPAFEAGVLDVIREKLACTQFCYTPERWRRYRHVYHRLCEKVDAQIGKILDTLDATGLAENTVVVFHADHGDHAGAHGLLQKSTSYEESARVPFIVAPPDAVGRVERHLVSTGIDLLPTLFDYAGIDAPDDLPGQSLRPVVEQRPDIPTRTAVFIESIHDGTDIAMRSVRTDRHKYTLYDRGPNREMLFDLEHDPGELVNLAVEDRHADTLA